MRRWRAVVCVFAMDVWESSRTSTCCLQGTQVLLTSQWGEATKHWTVCRPLNLLINAGQHAARAPHVAHACGAGGTPSKRGWG
jgi:hypothetical protein